MKSTFAFGEIQEEHCQLAVGERLLFGHKNLTQNSGNERARRRIHYRGGRDDVVAAAFVVVVVDVGGGLSLSLSGETRASHRRHRTVVHARGSRVTLVRRDFIARTQQGIRAYAIDHRAARLLRDRGLFLLELINFSKLCQANSA